jgi:hypothetical protein
MHYEVVGDPYCWTHETPAMPGPAVPEAQPTAAAR